MSTGIIKAQENKVTNSNKPKKINDWVKLYEGQIKKALPSVLTVERFSRMVLTAISQTPKLAECTPESFIGAMLTAAQLGLEPNTPLGQAYLIPYKDKCQFQIGYKGLLELAYRSGEFKNIEAHIVYENDLFEYEYGLNSDLKHKPAMKDRGEAICVYAVYKLNNGGYGFEVMSIEDIEIHSKKYSQSVNSKYSQNSPWHTDFESMAKKTVIKRLLKYAPLKTEFVQEMSKDEQNNKIEFDDDKEIIIVSDIVDENITEETIIDEQSNING